MLSFAGGACGIVSLERAFYPGSMVLKNGSLYFSDTSDAPVKRIDLQIGTMIPLVAKAGAPSGFCVQGDYIYWVETRSGWSEYCTGNGVIQVLKRTFGGWLKTVELAKGPNCASMALPLCQGLRPMLMPSVGTDFGVYEPRNPRGSHYYRCVEGYFEDWEAAWSDRYADTYGFRQLYAMDVIYRYLNCGDLCKGQI